MTAAAITTLACQKFIESSAGELAKKLTTDAIAYAEPAHQETDVALGLDWLVLLYKSQGGYSKAEPLLVRSLSTTLSTVGAGFSNASTTFGQPVSLHSQHAAEFGKFAANDGQVNSES